MFCVLNLVAFASWMMVASSYGGAEAQYNTSYATCTSTRGGTFGNGEICLAEDNATNMITLESGTAVDVTTLVAAGRLNAERGGWSFSEAVPAFNEGFIQGVAAHLTTHPTYTSFRRDHAAWLSVSGTSGLHLPLHVLFRDDRGLPLHLLFKNEDRFFVPPA